MIPFPVNIPGYNHLDDTELAQLNADIQQMYELFPELKSGSSSNSSSEDGDNGNAPSRRPSHIAENNTNSRGSENDNHPDKDAKTKRLREKFRIEKDRHFLETIDTIRRQAEADGRHFPEGISEWEELGDFMKERIRWAVWTLHKQKRSRAKKKNTRQTSQQIHQPSPSHLQGTTSQDDEANSQPLPSQNT